MNKLELWALTGGVPRYAELASSCGSLSEALRRCVLAKDGPLYAEARFLLQDEVSTSNVYWSILRAVASGSNRISEIAGRVGVPANQLTRYLGALSDLGLVRREVPATEPSPEKSKRGLYQFDDAVSASLVRVRGRVREPARVRTGRSGRNAHEGPTGCVTSRGRSSGPAASTRRTSSSGSAA